MGGFASFTVPFRKLSPEDIHSYWLGGTVDCITVGDSYGRPGDLGGVFVHGGGVSIVRLLGVGFEEQMAAKCVIKSVSDIQRANQLRNLFVGEDSQRRTEVVPLERAPRNRAPFDGSDNVPDGNAIVEFAREARTTTEAVFRTGTDDTFHVRSSACACVLIASG